MADLEDMLKILRGLGVKSATFLDGTVTGIEFFPSIPPLDMETLVPPATEGIPAGIGSDSTEFYAHNRAGGETNDVPAVKIPPAIANILRKPSVS